MSTQIRSASHRRRILGAATYTDKVLATGPLLYFPLNETAGAAAVNYGSLGTAANGSYTGVTLANAAGPAGEGMAPFFDGANDYVDIYSAALDAAFSGATGTVMAWAKVAAGAWNDGTIRKVFRILGDINNYYEMGQLAAANTSQHYGKAGGGAASINTGMSPATWICFAQTWSDGNNDDEFRAFISGAQTGATSANLNNWTAGGLNANGAVIGAASTVPQNPWHGWLAHAAVWDHVKTPAEILDLATV